MATSKQDPLQVLNQVFNEVLVQTGKHILKNPVGGVSTVRAKASDSMTAYHYALDDLESEITRAKAVILRDLEKLRAARAPAPAPTPVPAPQPVAPPAPMMMDLPSSAAHTMTAPAFAPKQEIKTAAPFPDMGMGISADVVDLTSNEKKPSPRVPTNVIRPPARPNYPVVKSEAKPSPKQASKPTPKLSQPPKVTPVPPPQIPRLQPPPQPAAQPQPAAPNPPQARVPQAAPDITSNTAMTGVNASGGDSSAPGGNALHFTDMQFSLAPSTAAEAPPPGAPPAPMPEFDLTTFAPQDSSNNNAGTASASATTTTAAAAAAQQQQQQPPPKEEDKTDTNLDDLFNLDANNDEMDSMFDLGSGANTFNDMFFDNSTNNDDDMQFDEQFFLP
ncbi:E3 ubiquitin-protein ligase pub1 [Hypoxylon texense]